MTDTRSSHKHGKISRLSRPPEFFIEMECSLIFVLVSVQISCQLLQGGMKNKGVDAFYRNLQSWRQFPFYVCVA